MNLSEKIREELGDAWIPEIYREKVKKQRTRSFELNFPAKENLVEIVHTLLGIQIKIRKKDDRMSGSFDGKVFARFCAFGM